MVKQNVCWEFLEISRNSTKIRLNVVFRKILKMQPP